MGKAKTRVVKSASVRKAKGQGKRTVGHPKVTKSRGRLVVKRGARTAETAAKAGAPERR